MLRYFCNLAGVELRNSALFMIDETKINEHKVFEKCKQSMTVETFTEWLKTATTHSISIQMYTVDRCKDKISLFQHGMSLVWTIH